MNINNLKKEGKNAQSEYRTYLDEESLFEIILNAYKLGLDQIDVQYVSPQAYEEYKKVLQDNGYSVILKYNDGKYVAFTIKWN